MKEYNVKVTVRNNLLLTAMNEAGYATQSDFARASGIKVTDINAMIGLRKAPILQSGEFSPVAKEIMEVLGACPTDLWTPEQLTMALKQNSSTFNVEFKDLESLSFYGRAIGGEISGDPEEIVNSKLIADQVDKTLKQLTPREQEVISKRFGIREKEMSLEEIAQSMDLSKERVRQIEAKALRKLREPARGMHDLVYPKTQEDAIISTKMREEGIKTAIEEFEKGREERYQQRLLKQEKYEEQRILVNKLLAEEYRTKSWVDYVKREDPELYEKMRGRVENILKEYE